MMLSRLGGLLLTAAARDLTVHNSPGLLMDCSRQLALLRCSLRTTLVPVQESAGLTRLYASATEKDSYSAEIEQLQTKIFGTHFGNNLRSGRKILRKPLIGHKIASYYPEEVSKNDPLYLDERFERQRAKIDKLKRRGKGPPKKGHGKRAGKRKSK